MLCPDLSFLCVTRGEKCVLDLLSKMYIDARSIGAEFCVFADGQEVLNNLDDWLCYDYLAVVESRGYIESVLDECLVILQESGLGGRYIFRLDDDESLSNPLLNWLSEGKYRSHPHWKFNRAHLWQDDKTVIVNPPLYPDHQTRLSTREMSLGRTSIHCGSPFGGGELCPYPILHHKFLVKSIEERQKIVDRYESVQHGAGEAFKIFSVPELVLQNDQFQLRSLEDVI